MKNRFQLILLFLLTIGSASNSIFGQKTLALPVVVDINIAEKPKKEYSLFKGNTITIDASNYLGNGQSLEAYENQYKEDIMNSMYQFQTQHKGQLVVLNSSNISLDEVPKLEAFIQNSILADGYTMKLNMFLVRKKLRAQNSARFSRDANELCDKYECDQILLIMVKANNFKDKKGTTDKFKGAVSVYTALMDGDSGNITKMKDWHSGPTFRSPEKGVASVRRENVVEKIEKFTSFLLRL